MSLPVELRDAQEWLHQARYGGLRTVTTEDVVEELIERIEAHPDSLKPCTTTDEQRRNGIGCDHEPVCPACAAVIAEEKIDCGIKENDRFDGKSCRLDGEDCAACTVFTLKRKADCENDDRTDPCASGATICLACQLARSQSALAELEQRVGPDVDAVALRAELAATQAELARTRSELATASNDATELADQCDRYRAGQPRPRRQRGPRPGEVNLLDALPPAPVDIVVTVAHTDAPPAPAATGRACGCQSRGPHRATCSRAAGRKGGDR